MAFSTRKGGVSSRPFDSLNVSTQEGDHLENVAENIQIVCDQIAVEPESLVSCNQVHGADVAIAESELPGQVEADAIITSSGGIFPTIRTADCLPILAIDPVRKVAAAIHAGWRSTIQRITGKVIRTLTKEFGTRPADLITALGPSIRPCCYEVDHNVLEQFHNNLPWAESCTFTLEQLRRKQVPSEIGPAVQIDLSPNATAKPVPMKPTRPAVSSFRIDLARANYCELLTAGILSQNIFVTNLCTACHQDLFFSYRRDSQRTGRHIAVVGFRR